MPSFDTDDGDRVYHDRRGTAFAGVQEAIGQARKLAFDPVSASPTVGRTILACVVRDETGMVE